MNGMFVRSRLTGMILVSLLLGAATCSFGQDNYDKVRKDILNLHKRIQSLSSEDASHANRLEALSLKRRLLKKKKKEIGHQDQLTRENIALLNAKIVELNGNRDLLTQSLRKGLRKAYALGQLREYRILLTAEKADQLLQMERYLRILGTQQKRQAEELAVTLEELASTGKDLKLRNQNLEDLALELAQDSRQLDQAIYEQRNLRRAIEQKIDLHREAMAEHKESLKKFDQFIQDQEIQGVLKRPDSGRLMIKKKGSLNPAVRGKIKHPFGDRVHAKFKTRVPHPGWTQNAVLGEKVHAIFDGEVVFADRFQGYGLTVILDHQNNYLTVYAHLDSLGVKRGQWVQERETLGRAGDSGSLSGSQLYFEIRYNGRPVDPAPWLRKPPAKNR